MPQLSLLSFLVIALLGPMAPGFGATQTIPFEYRDGYIWVKVRSDVCLETFNYVLDSGAGSSVVSRETAAKLKLRKGATVTASRVDTQEPTSWVEGLKASVAGTPLCRKALVLDLRSVSANCHQKIDGLLGQDFIRGKIMQIDFKAGTIQLLDVADERQCSVLRLRMHDNALCVPVSVNGSEPRWTRLDTGCDAGLHWVDGRRDGISRSVVSLGGDVLTNVSTVYHGEEIFPSEAGLLGTAVLKQFVVTIDAVRGRLLLRRV